MQHRTEATVSRTLRALTISTSAIAISIMLSGHALAQAAADPDVLPEVTVDPPNAAASKPAPKPYADEAPAPKKKVAKQKPKPKPAPAVAPEPEPEPVLEAVEATPENAATGAARDAAMQSRVYSTPGSVSSVGTSEISTFGASDMGDVLRSVPGTSVRESPSNPGVGVNIRGFEGSGRVNMMIDGVRQNFRFTGHEAQGFTYVDSNLLAGVDIARGAVSTAGGAGALAGTANFRTLDIIDVLKPGQTTGVLTTGSYGTNNQEWSGMAAGAVTNGRVGFVGAISGRNPNDFENGNGLEVPFTSQDLESGLVKGEFQLTEEQKIKLSGVFYRNDFVANSYEQSISSDIFSINYHYKPIDNPLVDLRVNASRSDVTMEYFAPWTPVPTFPALTAAGRNINTVGNGIDVTNISLLNLGGVRVRSEYGYEYFHDKVETINSTLQPGFGVNPSGESSIGGAFQSTTFSYGIVDLIAGLRYDRFDLSGTATLLAGNPYGATPGVYDVDKSDGRLNPKITLALSPTKWFQPYVTYAEAMRAPTINESLAGGEHPTTGGPRQGFLPNPFLDPEVQKGWEFGFNTAVDGVFVGRDLLRFKANYFNQDIEDYITAALTPAFAAYFINNEGTSHVQGVELQGMYDSGFFFAGASYSWNDTDLPTQINGFGGQSYMPEHVISVSAGVRLLDERWTLGARAFHASKGFVGDFNAADPDNPYTDGYSLLDLFTSYKITPDVEVGATMSNVFDKAYTPATSTPATGGFSDDTGRGRTTLFTMRAKF